MDSSDGLVMDIPYGKITEWLIKRRICQANWHEGIIPIREKINAAIQDMPAHDGITRLLTGTFWTVGVDDAYLYAVRLNHSVQGGISLIVEILKETEADSKNIFGRYSSQRMKDWNEIVRLYEKDNVGIAEAAQMLARNVNYEVPALKKQIQRLEKAKLECNRKESDYKSLSLEMKSKYSDTCKGLGIQGQNVKQELLSLASDLSTTLDRIGESCKELVDCLAYYTTFSHFLHSSAQDGDNVPCRMLTLMSKSGNVTTYEWRTGQTPTSVVNAASLLHSSSVTSHHDDSQPQGEDAVDWGDIDFGDDGDDAQPSEEIDYGLDLDIEVEETGNEELMATVDEAASGDQSRNDGVARGQDALSLLDNPVTRFQFVDELEELSCFLTQRIHSLSNSSSDVIVMSIMQSAPRSLQLTDKDLKSMLSKVQAIHTELSAPSLQKLLSIRNSPRYVERMTDSITKILEQSEKMTASARLMSIRYNEAEEEIIKTQPKIGVIRDKTMELKKQLEAEISKKFKNRPINIMGEINLM